MNKIGTLFDAFTTAFCNYKTVTAALTGTAPAENLPFQESLHNLYRFHLDLKVMIKNHNISLLHSHYFTTRSIKNTLQRPSLVVATKGRNNLPRTMTKTSKMAVLSCSNQPKRPVSPLFCIKKSPNHIWFFEFMVL